MTYGQAAQTYGGAGTYGAWGATPTEPTSGGRSTYWSPSRPTRLSRRRGRIDWIVDITGTGTVNGGTTVEIGAAARAVAGATTLTLRASHRSAIHAKHRTDMRVASTGEITSTGRFTVERALHLRSITDPPELWDLLDLIELTP